MPLTALETKHLSELDANDVESFVNARPAENESLEFKESLSSKAGDSEAEKNSGPRGAVTNEAKAVIARGVCALLNTYGGMLVIGIRENEGVAAGVIPLSACREVAEIIARSLAATISPSPTSLQLRGIEIDGDAGVVVIRVAQSERRPHAVVKGDMLRCFVRRGTQSMPLDMREVREMVLSSYFEADRLARRVEQLRSPFFDNYGPGWERRDQRVDRLPLFAIHVCAVPMISVSIPTIALENDISPSFPSVQAQRDGIVIQRLTHDFQLGSWRSAFRGRKAEFDCDQFSTSARFYEDGAFDYRLDVFSRDVTTIQSCDWVGAVATGLVWPDCIRALTNFSELSFAMATTIAIRRQVQIRDRNDHSGPLLDPGFYPSEPILINPRTDKSDILKQAWTDIYSIGGHSSQLQDIEIKVGRC